MFGERTLFWGSLCKTGKSGSKNREIRSFLQDEKQPGGISMGCLRIWYSAWSTGVFCVLLKGRAPVPPGSWKG